MPSFLTDFKSTKTICIWLALVFTVLFGLFFWVAQINGSEDFDLNRFGGVEYIGSQTPINNITLDLKHIFNKRHNLRRTRHPNQSRSHQILHHLNDHHPSITQEAVSSPIKNKWWEYNTTFTDCEQTHLGWKQGPQKVATFKAQNKNTLCWNHNVSRDLRHAHIECYNNQWRGSNICILKNIYGYIENGYTLKFKAFCESNPKNDILNRIKKTFKSSNTENIHYPLHLDLIDDKDNADIYKMDEVEYKDNNTDIWYYDNSHQCEWHKKNEKQHIGNPWHCFGHLEYWFGIAFIRNIKRNRYNITVVQSQFDDNHFGPKEAIYHFYDGLFDHVLNKNALRTHYKDDNKLFYIKELIIDERIAKDWGMSVIWQHNVKQSFNKCDNKNKRRSPIFLEMRKQMMNYYETNAIYYKYDWIQEILGINDKNKYLIYGDLRDLEHKKLVFIGSRWVDGVCRYRCIANGPQLKDAFLGLFKKINDKFVIIYGNPGVLSFYAQYQLFKNTRVFVGVHGAVFLMAGLFMPPWSLKFEITMPYDTGRPKQMTSEDIVAYFDDSKEDSYGKYFCMMCITKAKRKPSDIKIGAVINAFNKRLMCVIYELCRGDAKISDINNNQIKIDDNHNEEMGKAANKTESDITGNHENKKEVANKTESDIDTAVKDDVSDKENIERVDKDGIMGKELVKYTECEQKYLGWKRNSFGDLSFSEDKRINICVNNEYDKDLRHLNMECWHVFDNRGKNHICIIRNIYGFRSNDNKLWFRGYCKDKMSDNAKRLIGEIKKGFNGRDAELTKYPLYLDIVDDGENADKLRMDGVEYKDNNRDFWYYDNCHQCESHKGGDAEHIGNPWHCFSHIEYYYHIKHRLNISMNEYNTTVVMSQFTDYQFGANIPIYHFFTPFFNNIINKEVVPKLNDENNMFYIKEMIIDERVARGWGYGTIWKGENVRAFDNDNTCIDKKHRRSQIMLELKHDMMSYYESNEFYKNYDWIQEMKNIKGVNEWQINGDINNINNDNDNDNKYKLILIGSRWMNGICRYRCLGNIEKLKNRFIEYFNNEINDGYKYVVIFGNPGSISFMAQYHLFKNTNVFVGVHGAVFLMAALFMEPTNIKFEITMSGNKKEGITSQGVVSMLDGREYYAKYYCSYCEVKRGRTPSDIKIDDVITHFNKAIQEMV